MESTQWSVLGGGVQSLSMSSPLKYPLLSMFSLLKLQYLPRSMSSALNMFHSLYFFFSILFSLNVYPSQHLSSQCLPLSMPSSLDILPCQCLPFSNLNISPFQCLDKGATPRSYAPGNNIYSGRLSRVVAGEGHH